MRNKKTLLLVALLLLVGLTSGYVSKTYAKYVATLDDAEGTATIAKWAFTEGSTYGVFEVTLPATIDETTLVSSRIAPGVSGTFTIDLDNTESEVGVEFEIVFGTSDNVPANLVLKQSSTTVDVSSAKITGTIPAGGTLSIPLAWDWPYETAGTLAEEDSEDTADGEAALEMTLTAAVSGKQVAPGSSTLTAAYTLGTND